MVDIIPVTDIKTAYLQLICAGIWYQFTKQWVASYSTLQSSPHYFTEHEPEEPDAAPSYDYTGMVNKIGTGDGLADDATFEDTNKAWNVNEWQTGAPQKYGVIVVKNLARPAESAQYQATPTTEGAVENTQTNDDQFLSSYEYGGAASITLYAYTHIPRTSITALKIRCVVKNHFVGSSNGTIQIYNWDTASNDVVATMSAAQTYNASYTQSTAATPVPLTSAHIDPATGAIVVNFTAGVGQNNSKVSVYYFRVYLTVSSYPTLSFTIASNTANKITCTANVHTTLDYLDYYQIGVLSSEALKTLMTTYDTWQAITTTGVTNGTKFIARKWANEYVANIIDPLITAEKYDAWITMTHVLTTQNSASATSSGLKWDEASPNLQIGSFRSAILGSQIANRIIVVWANGTETAEDATSQTDYLYELDRIFIEKNIINRDEAYNYALYLLARYKDPQEDFAIKMNMYVHLVLGQSVVLNLPSQGVVAQTYVIRTLNYTFTESGTECIATIAKAGSTIHRYNTPQEDQSRLLQQFRALQQSLNTQTIPTGANVLTDESKIPKTLLTAKGDMIYATAEYTPAALPIGADNTYLKTNTDVPHWEALNIVEDTTPQLGGNLDCNAKTITGITDLIAAAAINLKVSGDTDDYLSILTTTDVPIISIIGGYVARLISDNANSVTLQLYDSAAQFANLEFHKTNHVLNLYSTGAINMMASADSSDYLYFSTAADVASLLPVEDNVHYLGSAALAFAHVYSYVFDDLSPGFDLPTAEEIVQSIEVLNGQIDHSKLHPAVQIMNKCQIPINPENLEEGTKEVTVLTRNIGACVTALMQVVKDQGARLKLLEGKQ